jgi:hypothetical protein
MSVDSFGMAMASLPAPTAPSAAAALAQFSLFAASADSKSLILNDVHINSLHYRAYVLVAATGDGRAAIFGGGCAGKVRRK